MARAAIPRRLTWRLGRVTGRLAETPRATTLVLEVPGWPGHRAGQHVDVRLTADDGYQAQRSYSIASAPEGEVVELTVVVVDDGEVSPYLVKEVREVDPRLLVSARSPDDLLYHEELERLEPRDGLRVAVTYTREAPPGWEGRRGRVDAAKLAELGAVPGARCFVCGPTAF